MARQSQGRLGAVRNFGDVKTAEGNLTRRKANITAPPYRVKWETAVHDSALRNLSQRYRRVQAQFQELGLVNLKAIEEYAKVNKRYTFLHDQIDDLTVQVEKISAESLPKVTSADNGKVLKVVDGVWSVAEENTL